MENEKKYHKDEQLSRHLIDQMVKENLQNKLEQEKQDKETMDLISKIQAEELQALEK